MSILGAVLYLFLAVVLGTTAVTLIRFASQRYRGRGQKVADRESKGEALQAALTFTVCLLVVPSLRPDALGDAWYWTWVDAFPVLAGVAWALLPERESSPAA